MLGRGAAQLWNHLLFTICLELKLPVSLIFAHWKSYVCSDKFSNRESSSAGMQKRRDYQLHIMRGNIWNDRVFEYQPFGISNFQQGIPYSQSIATTTFLWVSHSILVQIKFSCCFCFFLQWFICIQVLYHRDYSNEWNFLVVLLITWWTEEKLPGVHLDKFLLQTINFRDILRWAIENTIADAKSAPIICTFA